MNIIKKSPISEIGYNFIQPNYIPKNESEYYLRNIQNKSGINYRQLSAYEIEVLVRNRNQSDNWNNILVSDAFNPELVKNCKFFGLVRIGNLEPFCLEFNNLKMPVGLYNSTIISCDFGNNVVIDNVNYLSHYIIGNEVMLVNINELATTNHSKFGNGIIKEGENEQVRIWMEVCNENGGRQILPFNGMLPGDAYLWSRFRDDEKLQSRFKQFTEERFDNRRGYYGKIGDRTVIKNSRIIKDSWIGSDAYIKGANKLKNLTINSIPEAKTQIGEGCELVNGIIDIGCRIFYGVKAVRFVMASHSQLKYGARLINSYLGNNATISCCEVLNSLIFPAHEQHHNNSFLCAALLMGQSNMAAGATIGSNHNSRGADGEIIAARGFWPGLCVSLKHNSKFASYCIIAKGDYPAELNIQFPFSLVSNDTSNNQLVIMPAYWFQYNMYALARNAWKYQDRDNRIIKTQLLEFNYLAPDTVNEIINAIAILEEAAYNLVSRQNEEPSQNTNLINKKTKPDSPFHQDNINWNTQSLYLKNVEYSTRPVKIIKAKQAYEWYKNLISLYAANEILKFAKKNKYSTITQIAKSIPNKSALKAFENIGGQLIPLVSLNKAIGNIKSGKIKSWQELHSFYELIGSNYENEKFEHAIAAFKKVNKTTLNNNPEALKKLFSNAIQIRKNISENIKTSRQKDYQNPFRKMVYTNDEEMNAVIGEMAKNSFINEDQKELKEFIHSINNILSNPIKSLKKSKPQ